MHHLLAPDVTDPFRQPAILVEAEVVLGEWITLNLSRTRRFRWHHHFRVHRAHPTKEPMHLRIGLGRGRHITGGRAKHSRKDDRAAEEDGTSHCAPPWNHNDNG